MAEQSAKQDRLAPVWSHLTQLRPVRGAGSYLYDAAGTAYLDFTSGIGVTNTGHAHPRVVEAIKRQAEELLFAQVNIVVSPALERLAEALATVVHPELGSFFFSNSGAEAVEAAVKLARHATGRPNVIVFQGSFHGRTGQAMALTTSKTVYRHKYQPLPAGVVVAPFPYAYRYGWEEDATVDFCLAELELILKTQSAPDETAAFVIEPVLGEGGYVPAPKRFLQGLRRLADEHGIVLVFDEVQTGFGRTGKFFAYEHHGVLPDVMVMAKGLGSGLPISGIAARPALMAKWEKGTHGGTYGGGSTLPLAAACATIDALIAEDLPHNAERMGARLVAGLRRLQQEHHEIGDVRGLGLMIGVEFSGRKGLAKVVQQACLAENMLLLTCGVDDQVVRFIPPLVVSEGEIDQGLAVFGRAIAKATTAQIVGAV
ncbi:MAG TPA: aspartate aminotransferase family protein [Trueperaceae bacterium]|nr:aspartate aminotransferase family protein [Trueperaceae bacterium]